MIFRRFRRRQATKGCRTDRFSRRISLEALESRELLAVIGGLPEVGEGEGSAMHPLNVGTDLDGTNGFTLNGIASADDTGRSVSSVGDLNGDGFDDIVLGADGADPNGNLSGEIHVVFGRESGSPASLDLSSLDGTNGFRLRGEAAYDQAGLSVSAAGDVNGDGLDDLLIGALGHDGFGYDAGRAYILFGDDSFPAAFELSALVGSNGFSINGGVESDFLGTSVSGAGDVNGDGFDDVVIGAPYADPGDRTNAGAAYVVLGTDGNFAANLPISSLNGENGFALNGVSEDDLAGFSVSAAGDVNGDGYDDVLIGAYDADPNGPSSGSSYVVFGQASGVAASFELSSLDGSNGFSMHGANAADYSGWAVAGAGDLNGDGLDDIVVGAYQATGGESQSAGRSYVVFGSDNGFPSSIQLGQLDGAVGFALDGVATDDQSGRSVGSAGDVNADGFDDLIVGARRAGPNAIESAGEGYVVFGRTSFPATFELSSLNGMNGFTVEGDSLDGFLGLAVNSAGDTNGDGFADVLIGAPAATPPNEEDEAGEGYVIFGDDFSETVTHRGDSSDNQLDGDGAANILVGAQGNDSLVGAGGADILRGGQGDDILAISDLTFRSIAGGNGEDTLRLDGMGHNLNLSSFPDNFLTGIERVDLRGTGANALRVNSLEVVNLSDHSNRVIVHRNANDTVDLGTGWSENGVAEVDGDFFDVFVQGAAEVLLQKTGGPPWQNQANPLDVNNDTFISPVGDILPLINELNRPSIIDSSGNLPVPPTAPNLPPPFYDVSGDNLLTPVSDILPVINFLNTIGGEGEPEASFFPISLVLRSTQLENRQGDQRRDHVVSLVPTAAAPARLPPSAPTTTRAAIEAVISEWDDGDLLDDALLDHLTIGSDWPI